MSLDNIPALWKATVKTEPGSRREFLVVARNEQEVKWVLVEPGDEELVFGIEKIGPLPFGPGIVR